MPAVLDHASRSRQHGVLARRQSKLLPDRMHDKYQIWLEGLSDS